MLQPHIDLDDWMVFIQMLMHLNDFTKQCILGFLSTYNETVFGIYSEGRSGLRCLGDVQRLFTHVITRELFNCTRPKSG